MFHELTLGGLLFSPLVVFGLIAFIATLVTRFILHKLAIRQLIWKDAWFDVSLFICYLALLVYILGSDY